MPFPMILNDLMTIVVSFCLNWMCFTSPISQQSYTKLWTSINQLQLGVRL